MTLTTTLPIGTIIIFFGNEIPDGWLLCDGKNGTPNLIDKFILGGGINNVGAGSEKEIIKNASDGVYRIKQYTEFSESNISVEVLEHSLSISELPNHNHKQGDIYDINYAFGFGYWNVPLKDSWINGGALNNTKNNRVAPITESVGGSKGHSHKVEFNDKTHRHDVDIMPPYFILAYIMYKGLLNK
ncbi:MULTISPECIES: phage tail protein [unclassified Symbiopectobacterium]|uniref:phage tail protein n=1 Tax=unclassified Symbiopectobacterium TaxID=2794573 RepID=UPI002225C02E|nr:MULTISPECIES: phage tail protein [unclassified Symbiopectobacterium]MCW2477489.1 tail fiber protein [Candidatus Symbiopectobacterium sp. NZEC151]MCW2482027.1 tail fiber protein [Candidatus Symbiopectobacterium sp. NZEC135]MCW2488857.1 tail fiber protein [Candidatus Symbiopectobacterium sp. NZEC127]